MATRWVNSFVDGGILHARAGLPDRWDISIERIWCVGQGNRPTLRLSRRRLARAIRQDVWRVLQNVRGFAPRVQVSILNDSVHATVGGVLMSDRRESGLGERIAAVLDHPDNKNRWFAYARPKGD